MSVPYPSVISSARRRTPCSSLLPRRERSRTRRFSTGRRPWIFARSRRTGSPSGLRVGRPSFAPRPKPARRPRGRPWGGGWAGGVQAVGRWDDASVDRALELLLAADASLKETRVSSDVQLLKSLLLAMAVGRGRRAAAWAIGRGPALAAV